MKKVIASIFAALAFVSTAAFATEPATLWIIGGVSVSNSISDEKSRAWGVEQETPTANWGTWNLGYLNEGHKAGDKRDGIYAQYKFAYQFTPNVETAFHIGPYFTATTVTEPDGIHYRDAYCWSLLPSASVKYKINDNWSVRGMWSHVIYARDNKDADVFHFSVGYTPKWLN